MRNRLLIFALVATVAPLLGCSKKPACDDATPCGAGLVCLVAEGRCEPIPTTPDLAEVPDLSMPMPDMRMPEPDLLVPLCGGASRKHGTNSILLPSTAQRYAIDIDGDGRMDNQFRTVLSALTAAGFDLQIAVDDAVAAGQLVGLMDVQAKDVTNADCIVLEAHTAVPRAPGNAPRYDGTDVFQVPMGQPATSLRGTISAGTLGTTVPPKLDPDNPPRLDLDLPLLTGTVRLPLYGVHIEGQMSANGIRSGALHGVIKKEDIDLQLIPAIANVLTAQINGDPFSSTTQTLIKLFEDTVNLPVSRTKCMVAADCCAKSPMTCKILPDEVRQNSLIASVLAPDVQVFEGVKWKPVPAGTKKDAMSVGLGFSAVRATY